ncbi:MAG: hypothetical protein ACOZNI_06035 [Myxococcota bacterium]
MNLVLVTRIGEPIVAVIVPILLAVGALAIAHATRQRAKVVRRAIAEALGLAYGEGGWGEDDMLTGVRDGIGVNVRWHQRGVGRSKTKWTLLTAAGPPFGLTVKRQGVGTTFLRSLTGGDDHLVGDPAFDAAHVVDGDPVAFTLLLDGDTRAAVARLVRERGGEVDNGVVQVERRGHVWDPATLAALLDDLASLGRRLGEPVSAGRLRAVAVGDPEPGVRLRALRALGRGGDSLVAAAAAKEALADAATEVRLQATLLLGEPLDAFADEDLLAFAPFDPPGLARALARRGDEARLCRLLDVDHAGVRAAAARGLAEAGTVAAIPSLVPLTNGLLADDDVKRAARAAVEAIRGRLGDVDAGRLALADGEAGSVAIAEGEAGAVSLARKQGTTP